MPASRETVIRGLLFRARPGYGARRKTRFPLFFENHNSHFVVEVVRVEEASDGKWEGDSQGDWPDNEVKFRQRLEDGSSTELFAEVPPLALGESTTIDLGEVFVPHPGQVQIVIDENDYDTHSMVAIMRQTKWYVLYSYKVRSEESLWLAGGVIALAVLNLIGAALIAQCAPRPVNNNNVLPAPAPVVNVAPPVINNQIVLPTVAPTIGATVGP